MHHRWEGNGDGTHGELVVTKRGGGMRIVVPSTWAVRRAGAHHVLGARIQILSWIAATSQFATASVDPDGATGKRPARKVNPNSLLTYYAPVPPQPLKSTAPSAVTSTSAPGIPITASQVARMLSALERIADAMENVATDPKPPRAMANGAARPDA